MARTMSRGMGPVPTPTPRRLQSGSKRPDRVGPSRPLVPSGGIRAMGSSRKKWRGLAIFLASVAACGGSDLDGTEISVPYASLSGGLLFASSAVIETRGYDLYWVPVPAEATIVPQPIIRITHGDGN